MKASENTLSWLLRFYPPLFFQRIWVKKFHKGFTGVDVKVGKSFLNINYNRSVFGGTIYSAVDPFLPVLFFQIFAHLGDEVIVWQKAADIEFIKPAYQSLFFSITLAPADIDDAIRIVRSGEKYIRSFRVSITNAEGDECAVMNSTVYVRQKNIKMQ